MYDWMILEMSQPTIIGVVVSDDGLFGWLGPSCFRETVQKTWETIVRDICSVQRGVGRFD
jgi:hypothetical protein